MVSRSLVSKSLPLSEKWISNNFFFRLVFLLLLVFCFLFQKVMKWLGARFWFCWCSVIFVSFFSRFNFFNDWLTDGFYVCFCWWWCEGVMNYKKKKNSEHCWVLWILIHMRVGLNISRFFRIGDFVWCNHHTKDKGDVFQSFTLAANNVKEKQAGSQPSCQRRGGNQFWQWVEN